MYDCLCGLRVAIVMQLTLRTMIQSSMKKRLPIRGLDASIQTLKNTSSREINSIVSRGWRVPILLPTSQSFFLVIHEQKHFIFSHYKNIHIQSRYFVISKKRVLN